MAKLQQPSHQLQRTKEILNHSGNSVITCSKLCHDIKLAYALEVQLKVLASSLCKCK